MYHLSFIIRFWPKEAKGAGEYIRVGNNIGYGSAFSALKPNNLVAVMLDEAIAA